VAVAAFGFIAAILLLDVIGREFVGPLLRLVGIEPGATGIFAAQKLSIFALVIGSFAGIGIATATGSHIVPRFAYGWVPSRWGPAMDRLADALTGLFLLAVAWYGYKFVFSSFKVDLRAPVLDWPVWPIQLAIPMGFLSAAGRYLLYAVWPQLRPQPPEFQE
jgi:TRAP-type C4-dicarboxylate transport system permease small subunit